MGYSLSWEASWQLSTKLGLLHPFCYFKADLVMEIWTWAVYTYAHRPMYIAYNIAYKHKRFISKSGQSWLSEWPRFVDLEPLEDIGSIWNWQFCIISHQQASPLAALACLGLQWACLLVWKNTKSPASNASYAFQKPRHQKRKWFLSSAWNPA